MKYRYYKSNHRFGRIGRNIYRENVNKKKVAQWYNKLYCKWCDCGTDQNNLETCKGLTEITKEEAFLELL